MATVIPVAEDIRAHARAATRNAGEQPAANRPDDPDADTPVFLSLADALARPELLRPPEEIIRRVVWRGRATAVVGGDKAGKSTIAAACVAHVSRGEPIFGGDVAQANALWLGLEEAMGDGVRRFSEMGADGDRVRMVALARRTILEDTKAQLAELPASIVVVDSLMELARVQLGRAPEDGDNSGWGSLVRPWIQLARDYDVGLLVLHHPRRSDGAYRGALEIAAAFDCLYEMEPVKDDLTLRRFKGRARWPVEPFAVRKVGNRFELATGSEPTLDAMVLAYIVAHPGASTTATIQGVGKRAADVRRAIVQLHAAGTIKKTPGKGDRWIAAGQEEIDL